MGSKILHRLKTSGRALAAYWLMTLYGLGVFSGVVFITMPSAEAVLILLGFVAGTVGGQILGNIFGFLRPRMWLVVAAVLASCGLQIALTPALVAVPNIVVAIIWFIFPFALGSGFFAVRFRTEIFGAWIPLMYSVGATLILINSSDKLGAWKAGAKWAIWDIVTIPILAGALLFFIIYLVMRQSQALSLWQESVGAPLETTVARPRQFKPYARISWATWGCVIFLALGLTATTAVVSPFLFRTAEQDKGDGKKTKGKGKQGKNTQKGKGKGKGKGKPKKSDSEDPFKTPDTDWEKMQDGVREAARQGASLLTMLLILLVCIILIYLLFWRPLKRVAVLRHLERPAWPVPATERIQDLWRRALISLNDAGIEPSPTEPADTLARRANQILEKQFGQAPPGLNEAAAIYIRVHYDIGVQADDITDMAAAVELVTNFIEDKLSPWEQVKNLYAGLPSEEPS